jgi:uncharacterized protein
MFVTTERFIADALQNPHNAAIMAALPQVTLPNTWLVAGGLFQTVWNLLSSQAPAANIADYDIFYYDAADLSAEAELAASALVHARLAPVIAASGIQLDVKNQARVHLWFEAYFGYPYPALASVQDGIDRYLVPCTCVGMRPTQTGIEVYAPNGYADLYAGKLRPNPINDHRPTFLRKAQAYQRRWPWLEICAE